ncbi:hypothetical protein V6N13_073271 [Hibiscus sabdariffa]
MVDGQQRGRPPKEEVVVDMVDALERPGSDLPTGDQLMQKKGRTWEGSIVAKDSFLETVNGDIDAQPGLLSETGGKRDEHQPVGLHRLRRSCWGVQGRMC